MSQLILEQVTFQRFVAMGADDLRCILDELAAPRARRESGLDEAAVESLIRVMDRAGYTWVLELGIAAARAWAAPSRHQLNSAHGCLRGSLNLPWPARSP